MFPTPVLPTPSYGGENIYKIDHRQVVLQDADTGTILCVLEVEVALGYEFYEGRMTVDVMSYIIDGREYSCQPHLASNHSPVNPTYLNKLMTERFYDETQARAILSDDPAFAEVRNQVARQRERYEAEMTPRR